MYTQTRTLIVGLMLTLSIFGAGVRAQTGGNRNSAHAGVIWGGRQTALADGGYAIGGRRGHVDRSGYAIGS